MLETIIGIFIGFLLSQIAEIYKTEIKRNNILSVLYSLTLVGLPSVSEYNKTVTEQSEIEHLVPQFYATTPFEVAILSENGVPTEKKTVEITVKYLNKANDLNSASVVLRDTFYVPKESGAPGSRDLVKTYLRNQLNDQSVDFSMHFIINELRMQIEAEQNRNVWTRLIQMIGIPV